ncbi:tandem-95 repeat protein, partial [Dapis sp. BLCC M126]|uniref:beta strand repeat-containing protein n=1 Tax=Dapis sp. BLCC M126 TaxID=3400189 RepID=UPI003CE760A7
ADGNGTNYANFNFTVNDGTENSQIPNTITIDVTAVNDAPTTADNTITIEEDNSHTFSETDFSFSDIDNDTLASITITTLPTVGTLQLNGTDVTINQIITAADISNLVFTPEVDGDGTNYANFNFTVNDSTENSQIPNTITIDVTAVNDAPTTADNTITIEEDNSHTFSETDFSFSDIDNDTLASITITTLPTVGTLQLNGTDVTINQIITAADISNLVFTPEADGNGTNYANFNFTVNDGTQDSQTDNTITIDVTPVNDDSVADSNSIVVEEASLNTSLGLTIPTDVDGDTLTITVTGIPTLGTITKADGTEVNNRNTLTSAELEGLLYNAPADYNGTDDPGNFTYDVDDGTTTVSGSLDITITTVNDLPTLDLDGNDDSGTTENNYTTTFIEGGSPVAIGDSDVNITDVDDTNIESATITLTNRLDGDTVESLSVNGTLPTGITASNYDQGKGTITLTGSATLAEYQDAIAQIEYNNTSENPDTNARSIEIVVNDGDSDGNTATTTINITPSNDVPDAVDDSETTIEDRPVTATVLDNDSDLENDILTVTAVNGSSSNVGQEITLESQALLTLNSDGTYSYEPNGQFENLGEGETDTDSFTYTISDGNSTSQATVTITINGQNNPPVAQNDSETTNTDIVLNSEAVTFSITNNDSDIDSTLDLTTVDLDPSTPERDTSITALGEGSYIVDDAGNLTFTPENAFIGVTTPIRYTVKDNLGAVSNEANISIEVTEIGKLENDSTTTRPNTPVTFNIIDNDENINLTTIDLDPDTPGIQKTITVPSEGIFSIDDQGNVTFTPEEGFEGEASITYVANDQNGNPLEPAEISVNVELIPAPPPAPAPAPPPPASAPVPAPPAPPDANQPPVGQPDNANTTLNTSITIDILANDNDPEGDQIILNNIDLVTENGGTITFNNDATILYTPPVDFSGIDNFTYSIRDANNPISSPINVTINVNGAPPDKDELPPPPQIGTDNNDTLLGNGEDNVLEGRRGNDTIRAGKGDDFVDGGKNDDLIFGDLGNDTLVGGTGDETIFGGNSNPENPDFLGEDLIFGGEGNDLINGGFGNDTLFGGTGDDIIRGGKDDDFVYGEEGNEELYGDRGNDEIYGGLGNDLLFGNQDNDELRGNEGDDTLDGGDGVDTLTGGSGRDSFVVDQSLGADIITDFNINQDFFILGDGIIAEDLIITQGQNGTEIRFNNQLLVTLENVPADEVNDNIFRLIANRNNQPTIDLDSNGSSGVVGSNYQTTFTLNNPVNIADTDISITNPDNTNIQAGIITLSNPLDGINETLNLNENALNIVTATEINVTPYNPNIGELLLTGSATSAEYEEIIANIVYNNTTNSNTSDRLINIFINNGQNNSNIAVSTIKFNQPPNFPTILITQSEGSTDITVDNLTDSYEIALDSIPTDSIDILITPPPELNLGAGLGVPITLNFNPDNALIPQNIPVSTENSNITGSFDIQHSANINGIEEDLPFTVDGISTNIITANINQIIPTTGSISGTIFNDANSNGLFETGETGLANATVFLDLNQNGILDTTETATTTNELGNYTFANLSPDIYPVRAVSPTNNAIITTPESTVELLPNQTLNNRNIGYRIPNPGTIQFSNPTFTVTEGTPTATVNVTRTGGSDGIISVTLNLDDDTATQNLDYTNPNPNTISFADGDTTSQSITIPIIDDNLEEVTETVNLLLTDISRSATIGTPNNAVLQLFDNDTPTTPPASIPENPRTRFSPNTIISIEPDINANEDLIILSVGEVFDVTTESATLSFQYASQNINNQVRFFDTNGVEIGFPITLEPTSGNNGLSIFETVAPITLPLNTSLVSIGSATIEIEDIQLIV